MSKAFKKKTEELSGGKIIIDLQPAAQMPGKNII